jgi:hypothetical protein
VLGDAGQDDDALSDGARAVPHRKQIAIDPAKVTGDQVAFPVWISLTDPDLAALAAADGSDIYFTKPDGTPLEHQLQRWTKATGRLEAWVRADLADAVPTLLDLRYGDPGRAHGQNSPMVFSSSFAAVWHLDDSLATSAVADATSARSGTAMGLVPGDQGSAQLGGGITFDDNSKQIQFINPYTGSGPHTISAWVNQRGSNNCDSIVTVGESMDKQSRWFHSHYESPGNGTAAVGFYNNDWNNPSGMDLDGAGWVLVHWVFEGSVSRLYRDGAMTGSHQHQAGINTQGTAGYLGYAPANWGNCGLNGGLDEVRLATVARSAGWIATEYANQKSPQTFYSVGPDEAVP